MSEVSPPEHTIRSIGRHLLPPSHPSQIGYRNVPVPPMCQNRDTLAVTEHCSVCSRGNFPVTNMREAEKQCKKTSTY